MSRRVFSTRDASWYSRPDVHSVKKFHAYGTAGRAAQAACAGREGMFLDESSDSLASELTPERICRRGPCWRAYVAEMETHKAVTR